MGLFHHPWNLFVDSCGFCSASWCVPFLFFHSDVKNKLQTICQGHGMGTTCFILLFFKDKHRQMFDLWEGRNNWKKGRICSIGHMIPKKPPAGKFILDSAKKFEHEVYSTWNKGRTWNRLFLLWMAAALPVDSTSWVWMISAKKIRTKRVPAWRKIKVSSWTFLWF